MEHQLAAAEQVRGLGELDHVHPPDGQVQPVGCGEHLLARWIRRRRGRRGGPSPPRAEDPRRREWVRSSTGAWGWTFSTGDCWSSRPRPSRRRCWAGSYPGDSCRRVVVEVLLGVLIGPQGLGLVRATGAVEVLYVLGFGFLLFLAGQEVEPRRFRAPSFRLAGLNFIVCLALAALAAAGLRLLAPGADFRLLALALTASPVGVVVPVLSLLPEATAAALIGAALLSVLIFPAVALALRPWTRSDPSGVSRPGRAG